MKKIPHKGKVVGVADYTEIKPENEMYFVASSSRSTYYCTSKGKIVSIDKRNHKKTVLSTSLSGGVEKTVFLRVKGKRMQRLVKVIVARAVFHKKYQSYEIGHINGNPADNSVRNLFIRLKPVVIDRHIYERKDRS